MGRAEAKWTRRAAPRVEMNRSIAPWYRFGYDRRCDVFCRFGRKCSLCLGVAATKNSEDSCCIYTFCATHSCEKESPVYILASGGIMERVTGQWAYDCSCRSWRGAVQDQHSQLWPLHVTTYCAWGLCQRMNGDWKPNCSRAAEMTRGLQRMTGDGRACRTLALVKSDASTENELLGLASIVHHRAPSIVVHIP